MAEKKTNSNKKKKKKGENVKIYARIRELMPWEPKKVSLTSKGNTVRNQTKKGPTEYSFQKVFDINVDNMKIFNVMVQPLIDNVLSGFNAVLIAYGQTGSGKTFTMLGKPRLKVIGLLPYMLQEVINTPSVYKLELSAVEAFGHHVARIELYDLFNPQNQTLKWGEKKGNAAMEPTKARRVGIRNMEEAYEQIKYAHGGSHFAPTGKNPESSRGHVTFVAKVVQNASDGNDLTSYFVMVDCAGSEGESAFTKEFIASCDKDTLMQRRLEAGCINTGLCQLQIIFNELRVKGSLTNMIGNGLRKVLHSYINTQTILAVIFTFSPSINNTKSTESTLKFAVTAGMVKVRPVKQETTVNLDKLVKQLKVKIEKNNDKIDDQDEELLRLSGEIEQLRMEGINSGYLLDSAGQAERSAAIFGTEEDEKFVYIDDGMGGIQKIERQKGPEKFNKGMTSKLMSKLAGLKDDDSSDSGFGEDKELFSGVDKNLLKAARDEAKEYEQKSKANKNKSGNAGAGMLSKADMDEKNIEAEIQAMNDMEGLAAEEEQKMMMAEHMNAMPDYSHMTEAELLDNVDHTWQIIKDEKTGQESLKGQQKQVVAHLVDTNAWLFERLSEILDEKY